MPGQLRALRTHRGPVAQIVALGFPAAVAEAAALLLVAGVAVSAVDDTGGEVLTFETLIRLTMMISANDATYGIADLVADDIAAWTSAHGDIPAGACVAMHSGWSGKVGGDGFRNADAEGKQHYPGFHPEATQMLIEGGAAGSIAVDTLSLDHGASTTFDVHYQWLPSGRFGIENIANLDKVPAAGATLVVGAPKIRGGTGGPARIFAMV